MHTCFSISPRRRQSIQDCILPGFTSLSHAVFFRPGVSGAIFFRRTEDAAVGDMGFVLNSLSVETGWSAGSVFRSRITRVRGRLWPMSVGVADNMPR